MQPTVLVIGAAGGVGHGIASHLLDTGHAVIAAGRQREALLALGVRLGKPDALTLLPASVESDVAARALVRELRELRRRFAAIVVATGSLRHSARLLDCDEVFLDDRLHADVVSRHVAARHLVPLLAETSPGALYLDIGSAAAEFPWAGYGHHSVTSAAQRMLARVLHDESRGLAVRVQHLSLGGAVRTHLNAHCASDDWLDAAEVGAHVAGLIAGSDGAAAVLGLRAGGLPQPIDAYAFNLKERS